MKKSLRLAFILLLFGCNQKGGNNSDETIAIDESVVKTFEEIPFQGKNATVPNLTSDPHGNIYLSWIEKAPENSTLFFTSLLDNTWSDRILIAQGDNWFVNWADFPSLLVLESTYVAHYLAYMAVGKYSYGVNLVSSSDGNAWSQPMLAHDDNTPTEHGFVSLLPINKESYMAIWLDGRKYVDSENHQATKEMALRSAIFDFQGTKLDEDIIDSRTCDCCQTDGVITSKGPLVVYRDRGPMEVRDISISRFEDGSWSEPREVYADGWEIPGCPVNGPAIDVKGDKVSVTWFTGSGGISKVLIASSEDGGDQFNDPIRLDLGNPLGRVDVKQFEDFAVVTWMEEKDETAFIYCRKVFNNGSFEEPILIDETSSARASGFPRMVKDGNDIVFAWTVSGDPSTIKTKRGVFSD